MNSHPGEIQFHEYLDEALPEAERQEFERHLEGCEFCQNQLAETERLFARIEALPEIELGFDLAPAVMRAIEMRSRPAASLKWTAAIQALLGVAILGVTWPALKALGALPDVSAWLANLEVQVGAGAQAMLQTWLNLVETVSGFVPHWSDFPALELSTISLVTLLASATLLWLVGIGLLLRHPIQNGYPSNR